MAKILLVEDDLALARMYQIVLEKAGFQIDSALDGQEGLEKIKNGKPDLVMLDLVLPKKDGFEVLKEMQSDNQIQVPVVCLSVLQQKEDIERARALGAQDYFVKTETLPQELVRRVKDFVKSA